MFQGIIVDRNDLLLLLSEEGAFNAKTLTVNDIVEANRTGRYVACFRSDQRNTLEKKPVLIIEDDDIREFYAFVGTYTAAFHPFSSVFRVISRSAFESIFSNQDDIKRKLPRATIGIAIAEAMLQNGRATRSIDELSISHVRGTLSAPLLSALNIYGSNTPYQEIAHKWAVVFRAISGDKYTLSSEVTEVFDPLAQALFGSRSGPDSKLSRLISDIVHDVALSGKIESHHWDHFSSNFLGIREPFEKFRGPREERIRTLTTIIRNAELTADKNHAWSCFIGFMVALVSNGSLSYLPLSMEFSKNPSTVLWFAAWSSLLRENDILTTARALGLRCARDVFLVEDLFSSPRSDMSYDEFRNNASDKSFYNRLSNPRSAEIEIYPAVVSHIDLTRLLNDDRVMMQDSYARTVEEVQHYLERAKHALGRIGAGTSSRSRSRLK